MDISQLKLYEQKTRIFKKRIFKDYKNVSSLGYDENTNEGILILNSGESIFSVCMRCDFPLCMNYSKEELSFNIFDEFPLDNVQMVCPSLAITWPHDNPEPIIDEDLCISCGLCIQRCPVNAISYNDEFIAKINIQQNSYFIEKNYSNEEFLSIIQHYILLENKSILKEINNEHIEMVYSKIAEKTSNLSLQFPNLIIRNLFLELGISTAIRRRGDIYMRMDMLFSDSTQNIGIAEIENGRDTLNSPRNILDNIAVLHSRYNFKKENIIPLIVSFSFPNQRTDYWQLIQDIKKITKIEIYSITLGALLILLWKNKKISMDEIKLFYADSDNPSIRQSIKKLIEEDFDIGLGLLGVLEVTK
ncbi:4Fe-4S binding protein [Aliarcobacter cryaerophilus]|uniref:4Fe-4S binding protein n=1 Tax=Aliarcobacter cryaerophilus TaxID=28198 RepID=UPI0021B3A3AE|nr:4Fe-4S binding protein [Aliarcobacter cryaerophilus]MCT7515024.1 4Fe-4S binding protein [Aliarcobacter cryaerophilus]